MVEQQLGDMLRPGCSGAFTFPIEVRTPYLGFAVRHNTRVWLSSNLGVTDPSLLMDECLPAPAALIKRSVMIAGT